jgi:hypothetical protein
MRLMPAYTSFIFIFRVLSNSILISVRAFSIMDRLLFVTNTMVRLRMPNPSFFSLGVFRNAEDDPDAQIYRMGRYAFLLS